MAKNPTFEPSLAAGPLSMHADNPFLTFSDTLSHLRSTLQGAGFWETTTPVARAAQVPRGNRPKAGIGGGKYLRTMIGPALRATLAHHPRVFEIGPCFRDDDPDATHSPEFTMLDLYAADESYEFLQELSLSLIAPAVRGEVAIISVADAIWEHAGVDLRVNPLADALLALATAAGADASAAADKIVDRFVEVVIEPQTRGRTTFVRDFPVGGSEPCARLRPGSAAIANRFEIFVDGLEVVHGYEDEIDISAFKHRADAVGLLDDDQCRVVGMIREGIVTGSSVGLGIGVERLCMAIDGHRDIWRYRFASEF